MEHASSIKKHTGKLLYLDGMRGLMAINVILCHFVCVYYPQMYFETYALQTNDFLSCFVTTPLSVLVNGNIAVVYFMVLTGFLVGMSVFRSESVKIGSIAKKSISRYMRLLPVVAVVTLMTHVMMVLGLQRHLMIADPAANSTFLKDYCNFEPTLVSLLNNAFAKPFFRASDYVGPFWTIKYEFLGYILTLVCAACLRKSRWRRLLYMGIAGVVYVITDVYFSVFVMGLFVADLEFNQAPTAFSKYYENILENRFVIGAVFVLATYLSCCTMSPSPLYSLLYSIPGIGGVHIRAAGMCLFLFAAMRVELIQRILSWKPLLLLGECSFETYALHWPLMLSLEAALFIFFREKLAYHAAALLAFAITIPAIYTLAFVLHWLLGSCKILRKNKNHK